MNNSLKRDKQQTAFSHKGESLANLSDSVYVLLDLSGKVLEINPSVQKLLGHTAESYIGHSFFSAWSVPNMGKALIKQVLCDKILRDFVADIQHQDGSTIIASINAQFIMDKKRRTAGIECLVTDVTHIQQQEQNFDETLRNVTGGIAHLINNQMAAVVGTADLLKMQLWDRPDLAEKLDRISASGLQAGDVAHNLVAYAETGVKEKAQSIDLNCIVAAVSRQYKQEGYQKNPRQLSFDMESNIHPVLGSQREFSKILNYMLDNALEATAEGNSIIIRTKNVDFPRQSTGEKQQHVMLSIEDAGHGMDKKTQHRVFEPFFSTRFEGRGMSMAHVLKIVETCDGHIHIQSKVDQGSTFTMHFPAITAA
ncbi:MAG: ATP-binding protein [Mariprofundaceae bacterium]|nr:ATP-binding protein [Mariprofundaceae bacterium]